MYNYMYSVYFKKAPCYVIYANNKGNNCNTCHNDSVTFLQIALTNL